MASHYDHDHLYQIGQLLQNIPRKRWMILPFIKNVRVPTLINNINNLSDAMTISDSNIIDLLTCNKLVRISKCKVSNKILGLTYCKNEAMWNILVPTGNVTICLEEFSKYLYTSLWASNTSSSKKHKVGDVHNAIVHYNKLRTTKAKRKVAEEVNAFITVFNSPTITTNVEIG